MKKLILILLILSLSSCAMKNSDYECQVSAFPTGKDPCDFEGGQVHMCQLRGGYTSGVPDYCTGFCLKRSKFLTSNNLWNAPINEECIEVSIAHSSFKYPDMSPEQRRIETIGFEVEEVDAKGCLTESDCCFEQGKCWIDGECKACSKGECEFDSDCRAFCQGNTKVNQGCNLFEAKCEATAFKEDCTKLIDTIAGQKIPRVCKAGACLLDTTKLSQERNELRDEYNQLTYARQELTEVRQKFERECLRALSDVTNKLIIDSAVWMSGITGSVVKLMASGTGQVLEQGMNKAAEGEMKPAEFIAFTCTMNKKIAKDMQEIDQKQEDLIKKIKEMDSK